MEAIPEIVYGEYRQMKKRTVKEKGFELLRK